MDLSNPQQRVKLLMEGDDALIVLTIAIMIAGFINGISCMFGAFAALVVLHILMWIRRRKILRELSLVSPNKSARRHSPSPAESQPGSPACCDSPRSRPQCTCGSKPRTPIECREEIGGSQRLTCFFPPSGEDKRGKWHTYTCLYWHDTAWWGLDLVAYGFDDAQERLRQIGRTGKVEGPLYAIIPAKAGFLVKSFCRIANLWRWLKSAARGEAGGRS